MIHAWLNIPIRTNTENQRVGATIMYLESHGVFMSRLSIITDPSFRGADPRYTLVMSVRHVSMEARLFERLLYTLAEMLHVTSIAVVYPDEPTADSPLGRGILVGPDTEQNLFNPAKFII